MNTRYLKPPTPIAQRATAELQTRVSEMLLEIERDGLDAVRRYSRELDGWHPEDFTVSDAEFMRAASDLDDPLKEHIAFAQKQIRSFAWRNARRSVTSRSRWGRASCSVTSTFRSTPLVRTFRATDTRCSPRRS
jgi:histidinol dehydrogenase